jgi:subtilisin family serine protease
MDIAVSSSVKLPIAAAALLAVGLAAACSSFPAVGSADRGQEASYILGRRVFYLSLNRWSDDCPWLAPSDRAALRQAQRLLPGLYEHLMGFYPYSVLFEDDRPGEPTRSFPSLARRLAAEFLGSISDRPAVTGLSSVECAVIGSGYETRRERPSFRRLVRKTAPDVKANWTWQQLHMDEAHRLATGLGVRLAVIDTGFDPTIKDIRRRVVEYRDFLAGERPFWGKRRFPYDWGGHGTGVVSVAAQAAPEAGLLVARVYDDESMHRTPANWWTLNLIEAGIAWAVERRADIINLSFGVRGDPQRLRTLVRHCWEKNILLVASVGNVLAPEDAGSTYYPAAYPWSLAVGGVEKQGAALRVWDHSGSGDYIDVVAPAASIWVEQPSYLDQKRSPGRAYGNSMATAIVSGTAALVLSAMDPAEKDRLRRTPGALCDRLREILRGTASNARLGLDGLNPHSGHGLIDPVRAVQAARSGRR